MMNTFTCGILSDLILSEFMSSRDLGKYVDHIGLVMFIGLIHIGSSELIIIG